MSKKNFEVYFDFGSSKIRASAFNKSNKNQNYFIEVDCLSNLKVNELNFSKSTEIIEKTISEIEKKTGEYLNDIYLMIDSPDAVAIGLSISKKIEKIKLKKKEIQYLIQDAKQQILRFYPDQNIIHIVVTNYNIDNTSYKLMPLDIDCKNLSIDIVFICFPKKVVKDLKELFNKFNISINQLIFSSYAKSLSYKNQLEFFENVAFIDIGYEKTSIVYFDKNNFNFFNLLPIGGNHITKDISKVLNIDLDKSEKVKLNFDKNNNFLYENNLSLDLTKKIIFTRIEEILELSVKFYKTHKTEGKLEKLILILTGQGSKILNNNFKKNIIFSYEINLLDETGLDICESGLNLIRGINKQEVALIPKKLEKKGFFEKLFHFFK